MGIASPHCVIISFHRGVLFFLLSRRIALTVLLDFTICRGSPVSVYAAHGVHRCLPSLPQHGSFSAMWLHRFLLPLSRLSVALSFFILSSPPIPSCAYLSFLSSFSCPFLGVFASSRSVPPPADAPPHDGHTPTHANDDAESCGHHYHNAR